MERDVWIRTAHCADLMQGVGLATFVSGAILHLVIAPPFHAADAHHPHQCPILPTRFRLARQGRENAMARTFAPICRCKEPPHSRGLCAVHRVCSARARWGQDDGSVAHPTKPFPGGTQTIGTCPGRHWEVHCRTTGRQSPHSSFWPETHWRIRISPSRSSINSLRSVQLTFRVVYFLLTNFIFSLFAPFFWHNLIACRVEGGNVAIDLELGNLDCVPTSNVPIAND